jgi:hypothetical protein
MFTSDQGDGKVYIYIHIRARAAAQLLRVLCVTARQTAADADDVWGDIRDDGDEAESAAAAAREAAVAAAVDRLRAAGSPRVAAV